MQQILEWLDGKKAVIAGALHVLNAYFVTVGLYGSAEGTLIASLILILTGIGVQQTNAVLGIKYRAK